MVDLDWQDLLNKLETGEIRAANKGSDGSWITNVKVKQGILAAFRAGELHEYDNNYLGFVDKHNLPPQKFNSSNKIRLVPGGSSVRSGAYVASGVIIMPPSYINVGAYVGSGSLVDSHVLVGSCAQIGKNVHLSAGVQIGGVLEPINAIPVAVEDDVFIGAGSIVVEGILVKQRAVIAPGVILSKSISIYDCVNQAILPKGSAVPENAVVIPGTRPISNDWGKANGICIQCPVIIKYRDSKTDSSLVLEEILR